MPAPSVHQKRLSFSLFSHNVCVWCGVCERECICKMVDFILSSGAVHLSFPDKVSRRELLLSNSAVTELGWLARPGSPAATSSSSVCFIWSFPYRDARD